MKQYNIIVCKECRHCYTAEANWCKFHNRPTVITAFCSCGEDKDGNYCTEISTEECKDCVIQL